MDYFTILLRYIHQNPVKAGIVSQVKDYEYSSWDEYDGTVEPVFQICNTSTVLNRIPYPDLKALVNQPLKDDVSCLDIEDPSKTRPSDEKVRQMILELSGATNISSFQQLEDEKKRTTLKQLKALGASLRQLERLTGLGKSIIQRI